MNQKIRINAKVAEYTEGAEKREEGTNGDAVQNKYTDV